MQIGKQIMTEEPAERQEYVAQGQEDLAWAAFYADARRLAALARTRRSAHQQVARTEAV